MSNQALIQLTAIKSFILGLNESVQDKTLENVIQDLQKVINKYSNAIEINTQKEIEYER